MANKLRCKIAMEVLEAWVGVWEMGWRGGGKRDGKGVENATRELDWMMRQRIS
jgi:hypothetical protein